jgi:hypothetical protein
MEVKSCAYDSGFKEFSAVHGPQSQRKISLHIIEFMLESVAGSYRFAIHMTSLFEPSEFASVNNLYVRSMRI